MLPGILGIMPGLSSASARVATYLSYVETVGPSGTYSFTSYNIGSADSSRRIFGIIHWSEGSIHRTLSSVTLAGVSATIHVQIGHTGGSTGLGVAIVSALVPTGTSGTMVANFSGTATSCSFAAVYTTGMNRTTPFDTASDQNGGTTASLNAVINVDTDGFVIAAMTGSTFAASDFVTWTGVTEQYDLSTGAPIHASMGLQSGLSSQTGRAIQASVSATINAGNDLAVVSWS